MGKKIIVLIATLLLLFFSVDTVNAEEKNITLHFFWANGCPHCAKEKIFLEKIRETYPKLEIKDYEITGSRENRELMQKIGNELPADVSGVPFTVIGKKFFTGYLDDDTTGKQIEEAIDCALRDGCDDIISTLTHSKAKETVNDTGKNIPDILNIPIIGSIKINNLSLPVLTLVIGLLDGFNPCAMWTLLFLISLLLGMQNRKRMWMLGIVFIASSAFVYFLFMSAWLNFFLFLGFVVWVRIIIGCVALGAGGYNLRDYFVNTSGGCSVMGNEKRQRVFERIKAVIYRKQFLFALAGIILLAFAVNLVELICSAGLPAIYTQILSLSKLPVWQYYLYLILYVLIFMLDDLFIFFTAMITLQVVGIQSKYARFSHLIGGILMIIIGILLLFKPELLMFG